MNGRNRHPGRDGGIAGDFAVGCLVFVLIAITLPLLMIVLKVTFWLAVPVALAIAAFVGIVLLGRIVRGMF